MEKRKQAAAEHSDEDDLRLARLLEGFQSGSVAGPSGQEPSAVGKRALEFLELVRRDHEIQAQAEHETGTTGDTIRDDKVVKEIRHDDDLPASESPFATKIGRFQIQRLLGQGGFAKVFLAHDPLLDREVALKVLRDTESFSDEPGLRFEREARAAAMLSHPNIVPVFDTGQINGTRYIATGYCEGQTLRDWMDGQSLPLRAELAAHIISVLADAVEHAHRRGIVHRDLKPANIMIDYRDHQASATDSGLPGRLMIADFGLARLLESPDQSVTHEGAIVGTPLYMSPEQARGDTSAGATVDVYSLGVMLYELLTGSLPLQGQNNIETLLLISRQPPRPPRNLCPSIPRDLEAICLRCLEKSESQRYSSAHDLSRDLQRFLDGEPVLARPVNRFTRVTRWCQRNPGFTFAFAAVAVALVLASSLWLQATRNRELAERNLATAQNVISEMATRLADDKDLPPELRRSFTERAVALQRQLQEASPGNEEIAIRTANASHRLIVVLFDLGEFEEALQIAKQTSAMLEPFGDSSAIQAARQATLRYESTVLRMQGELEESSEVVEALRSTEGDSTLNQARNHLEAGQNLFARRELQAAIDELELGQELFAALAAEDQHHVRPDMARTLLFLGLARQGMGRNDLALMDYEEALDLFLSLKDFPRTGNAWLEDAGRCYLQSGIILAQRSLPSDGPPSLENLELARLNYGNAITTFNQVRSNDPERVVAYGLELMTLEMLIELEFRHKNSKEIRPLLEAMEQVVESTPRQMREFPLMERILVQASLKQVQLLRDNTDLDEVNALLEGCELRLAHLSAEHPDLKDLNQVIDSFNSLRESIQESGNNR